MLKTQINIIDILLAIILFLDSGCLYLFQLPGFFTLLNAPTKKYLIIILIIFTMLLLIKNIKIFMSRNMFLPKYLFILIFSLSLLTVYSMFTYNESFFDVFTCWHSYLLIFAVIPLLYVYYRDGNIDRFFRFCNFLSVIVCVLFILQSYAYSAGHSIFLAGLNDDTVRLRMGHLRIDMVSVVNLTIIYNATQLFNGKKMDKSKKIQILLILLLELYTLFAVSMSRSYLVIFIGVIMITFISHNKSRWLRYAVLSIVILLAYQLINISAFISTFSSNASAGTGLSTSNRLNAIAYYLDVFKNNPFFGNGYIRESRIDLVNILHGVSGTYYYTDLGVFGVIAESGILGFLIYLTLLIYLSITFLKFKRIRPIIEKQDYSFMVGLLSYWILTSINLVVVNPRNSIIVPITIAIFEFLKIKYGLLKLSSKRKNLKPSFPHNYSK